ncbi:MAG: hypothetical protein Q8P93_03130 [bacterium]|nr:hypothetical protein [bacterium]
MNETFPGHSESEDNANKTQYGHNPDESIPAGETSASFAAKLGAHEAKSENHEYFDDWNRWKIGDSVAHMNRTTGEIEKGVIHKIDDKYVVVEVTTQDELLYDKVRKKTFSRLQFIEKKNSKDFEYSYPLQIWMNLYEERKDLILKAKQNIPPSTRLALIKRINELNERMHSLETSYSQVSDFLRKKEQERE